MSAPWPERRGAPDVPLPRKLTAYQTHLPPPAFVESKLMLAEAVATLCQLAFWAEDAWVQATLLREAAHAVEELRERLLPFAHWIPPLLPPFGDLTDVHRRTEP